MKKFIILGLGIVLILISCLKPARDNPFDPDNPQKANLTGYILSADGKVGEARIILKYYGYNDNKVYAETTADNEGKYEFLEVDPGIYRILAFAPHYLTGGYFPESLPAGMSDTVNLYLPGMIFDFDDVPIGTKEPYNFKVTFGNWMVKSENNAPSPPNVYNCNDTLGLSLYNKIMDNCCISIELMIKNLPPSGKAGIVLRFTDHLNYYLVAISKDTLSFGKFVDGIYDPLGSAPNSINANEWYNLFVESSGEYFKIYFNGEMKIDETDEEFSEGKFGALIYGEDNIPSDVCFDDVKILR